jgi:plasmid maintenance system antidote protein VapI
MNELIEKGKEFATKAHEGQTRKTSGAPYIGHPLHVAKILQDAGMSPVVVVAGFLHDVVEDTDIKMEDIQKEFGNEVTDLVAYNTEEKEHSWEERKEHTIEQLKTGTLHQKALVVADKYANLLELIRNFEKLGDTIWDCFKRGKQHQYWYFSSVAKSGKENLLPEEIPAFFHEYEKSVELFFNIDRKTMGRSFQPGFAIAPGETLKELLELKEWSIIDVVNLSGIEKSDIENILSGEREITEDIALQLGKLTGISQGFWLNLERGYQETKERLKKSE